MEGRDGDRTTSQMSPKFFITLFNASCMSASLNVGKYNLLRSFLRRPKLMNHFFVGHGLLRVGEV